jgi:hypothetical protein
VNHFTSSMTSRGLPAPTTGARLAIFNSNV